MYSFPFYLSPRFRRPITLFLVPRRPFRLPYPTIVGGGYFATHNTINVHVSLYMYVCTRVCIIYTGSHITRRQSDVLFVTTTTTSLFFFSSLFHSFRLHNNTPPPHPVYVAASATCRRDGNRSRATEGKCFRVVEIRADETFVSSTHDRDSIS